MTWGLWAWVIDRMLVCFKVIRKKIRREGLWEEIINPISAMFCHYSLCLGEEVSLPLTTPLCPPDSSSSSFHLIIGYILSSAFSGSVPPLSLISDIPLGELLLFLTSQLLTPLELKVHFLLSHFPLVRKVFLKKNLFFFSQLFTPVHMTTLFNKVPPIP